MRQLEAAGGVEHLKKGEIIMSDCREIEINGVKYVKKESGVTGDYYIVRTYSAGVFAGNIKKRDGKEITLTDARRIWYWAGAASLSQLAMEGTKKPKECKFPCPVTVTLTEVIEILTCTVEAEKSIKAVPIWEM